MLGSSSLRKQEMPQLNAPNMWNQQFWAVFQHF